MLAWGRGRWAVSQKLSIDPINFPHSFLPSSGISSVTSQFLEASHLRSSSPDGFLETCYSDGSRTSSVVVNLCILLYVWQQCSALLVHFLLSSGYLCQQDSLLDSC